jgi:hypothetical protein
VPGTIETLPLPSERISEAADNVVLREELTYWLETHHTVISPEWYEAHPPELPYVPPPITWITSDWSTLLPERLRRRSITTMNYQTDRAGWLAPGALRFPDWEWQEMEGFCASIPLM